jgi:D-alanyl-D-alanine carboxypeptidase
MILSYTIADMRILKKRYLLIVLVLTVFLIALIHFVWPNKAVAPIGQNQTKITNNSPTAFNDDRFSKTAPASIWVVVNKQHPLVPINYAPTDLVVPAVPLRVPGNESMQLRSATAGALEQMFGAAKVDGLVLKLSSGYRSYNYQVGLYNGYVSSEGQAAADSQSARPGHSEHQTGLAVDIEPNDRKCELLPCFADTPEGRWLVTNSYKYGFILRYLPDKAAVTGYASEPWHFRYVGKDLAEQMHASNISTLEEFFGISGGQSY